MHGGSLVQLFRPDWHWPGHPLLLFALGLPTICCWLTITGWFLLHTRRNSMRNTRLARTRLAQLIFDSAGWLTPLTGGGALWLTVVIVVAVTHDLDATPAFLSALLFWFQAVSIAHLRYLLHEREFFGGILDN